MSEQDRIRASVCGEGQGAEDSGETPASSGDRARGDRLEEIPGTDRSYPFFVVGLGASAGGLEALEQFFEAVPEDCGVAFVVVQHLSPDFKSLMDELLSRRTRLPVRRIEDGQEIEPGVIHLIPPRTELTLNRRRFCLSERDTTKGPSFPIDSFFRSMAADAGEKGVAVVLSGTGSDGTRGVAEVHKAGGLVVVQSLSTAKFDGMPRNVIETGLARIILPPEELPQAILRRIRQRGGGELELGPGPDEPGPSADLQVIFDLLNKEFGIDFSAYKSNTVARRLDRRIEMTRSADLPGYVQRVRSDPQELGRLYFDLLIGVTRFFRDPDAFATLASHVLPDLIERLGPGEELRVWVAGCATGEEAYSLAILIHEQFEAIGLLPAFRIFATDVHPESIEIASAGYFDSTTLDGVDGDRLARFFVPRGSRYQIAPSLRSRIVFSRQNMIKDAPFTRIDLISCRNLLIYFQLLTQRKAISMFHFGLTVGGVLFLGPSESIGEFGDEFDTIDAHWKLYRKRRSIRLRVEVPNPVPAEPGPGRWHTAARGGRTSLTNPSLQGIYDAILGEFMPPAILINERREVVHSFAGAGRFLVQQDGQFSSDLLDMIDDGLRLAVATALHRSAKSGEPVSYSAIPAVTPNGKALVRMTVRPMRDRRTKLGYSLVVFEEDPEPVPAQSIEPALASAEPADLSEISRLRVRELELELIQTKESLHATIEELQTSNEELQATNEEMIASNEELQSTNEELHSVNEELYTVNSEHQKKIEELTELTHDLDNLFVSTDLGIVFLDRDLRIRKFTPRIEDQFALLPQDVGRRIDGFAHNLLEVNLLGLIEGVLESGLPYEGEVRDRKSNWFLLRVHPYRSEHRINGIVLALIDISGLKGVQSELAVSERRHKALTRMFSSVLWTANADGEFVVDPAQGGGDGEDAPPASWFDAILVEDRERVRSLWARSLATREPLETWARIWFPEEQDYHDAEIRATPVITPDGAVAEWVGQVVDVHERKRIDQEFQAIVDNVQVAILLKDAEGRIIRVNPFFAALVGLTPEDIVGRHEQDLLPGAVAEQLREQLKEVVENRQPSSRETDWIIRGQSRSFLVAQCPIIDVGGRPSSFVTIFSEVTALKEIQQERAVSAQLVEQVERQERAEAEANEAVRRRDLFLSMLSHELRNPLNAIVHAAELLGRPEFRTNGREGDLHEIIRCQARHLGFLLNDLLDISRLNHGRINLRLERVDLLRTTEEAIAVVRPEAEAKQIDLVVAVAARPIWLHGDPTRLQQIQVNLLSNAIRYTPEGGRVEILIQLEEGMVSLVVRDNGRGMTPEILSRVFSLFYRGPDLANDRSESMGIGLTLVERLVELHGGTISAESAGPGLGSAFCVRFPRRDDPSEHPAPRMGLAVYDKSQRTSGRIVLIEDNHDTRMMLSMALELDGFHVQAAGDGQSGLDLIRSARPDVAVVDIELPVLDGCEVARQVRGDRRLDSVVLVALTGYGQASDTEALARVGFQYHLVKPIRPAEVSAFLDQRLGERPGRRDPQSG